MANILFILDDEEDIRDCLFIWFRNLGYQVGTFPNSKELFKACEKQVPDVILLDVNVNGEDGRDICYHLKMKMDYQPPVLLFSANHANGENLEQYHASAFIDKPFALPELTAMIAAYAEAEIS